MAGLGNRMMGAARSGMIIPWVGLAAGVCIQILAGSAYTFALYSSKLKSVLGYNQLQLSNLGVANDIGENVGLLAGLLCNKIPPWGILLIGVATSFVGYGVIWLVVSQTINQLPYWVGLDVQLCKRTHLMVKCSLAECTVSLMYAVAHCCFKKTLPRGQQLG